MSLRHKNKCAVRNNLFRVVGELDRRIYPLGLKEEVKYVDNLNVALNSKYSKIEIAKMLRRIMSYTILTNSPVKAAVLLEKRNFKTISEDELVVVTNYIIENNQYIGRRNRS